MAFKKSGKFRARGKGAAVRKTYKRKGQFKAKYPMITAIAPKMPRGSLAGFNDPNPFPATMRTKFVYTGEETLSTNSGFVTCGTEYLWRLNSAYDPYTGTTGNFNDGTYQFTKLLSATGPYTRYKVNAVLVDVLAYDPAGTSSDSTELCCLVTNPAVSQTLAGNMPYDLEKMPMSCIKRVADSGSQRRRIKQYIPMYQVFGWSKEQFRADKDNTTAPYNDSPASIPLLHIAVANARAASPATSVMVRVKLTYFCELYGRINNELS